MHRVPGVGRTRSEEARPEGVPGVGWNGSVHSSEGWSEAGFRPIESRVRRSSFVGDPVSVNLRVLSGMSLPGQGLRC